MSTKPLYLLMALAATLFVGLTNTACNVPDGVTPDSAVVETIDAATPVVDGQQPDGMQPVDAPLPTDAGPTPDARVDAPLPTDAGIDAPPPACGSLQYVSITLDQFSDGNLNEADANDSGASIEILNVCRWSSNNPGATLCTNGDLLVTIPFTGSATRNSDYRVIGQVNFPGAGQPTILIPNGQSCVQFCDQVINDTVPNEGNETVVTCATDMPTYNLRSDSCATVTLHDDDIVGDQIPVAVADDVATNEDTAVTFNVTLNDNLGNAPTAVVSASIPLHGTISLTGNQITYTPGQNYNGSDVFTYRLRDADGDMSNTVGVNITVNPVNDDPDARDDSFSTPQNTQIPMNVTVNDIDVDGNTLIIVGLSNLPAAGVATCNSTATTVTCTPTATFTGSFSFRYTISDGAGGIDAAQVNVTVTPVSSTCSIQPQDCNNSLYPFIVGTFHPATASTQCGCTYETIECDKAAGQIASGYLNPRIYPWGTHGPGPDFPLPAFDALPANTYQFGVGTCSAESYDQNGNPVPFVRRGHLWNLATQSPFLPGWVQTFFTGQWKRITFDGANLITWASKRKIPQFLLDMNEQYELEAQELPHNPLREFRKRMIWTQLVIGYSEEIGDYSELMKREAMGLSTP